MIDLKPLGSFIKKANESPDPALRFYASQLAPNQEMVDEENPDPETSGNNQKLELEDFLLNSAMPDLNTPDDKDDIFGNLNRRSTRASLWDKYQNIQKQSSAYV